MARAIAPVLRELGPQSRFLELGGGSGAFAEVLLRQGARSIIVLVAARTPMVALDLAKSRHV